MTLAALEGLSKGSVIVRWAVGADLPSRVKDFFKRCMVSLWIAVLVAFVGSHAPF